MKNNTVTIDAAGCQKSIIKLIISKKGNYVLGLKRNHPKLHDAVIKHILQEGENDKNRLLDSFDESHGRLVRRRYFSYDISNVPEIKDWSDAQTVIAVEIISSKNNYPNRKISTAWHYYLSNHSHTNKQLPNYIRNHWGIENKLHWILDVHLKEDSDKKAERKSTRSFALLKRIAVNIVRSKDTDPKKSLRRKLKHPAWDDNYLIAMLSE